MPCRACRGIKSIDQVSNNLYSLYANVIHTRLYIPIDATSTKPTKPRSVVVKPIVHLRSLCRFYFRYNFHKNRPILEIQKQANCASAAICFAYSNMALLQPTHYFQRQGEHKWTIVTKQTNFTVATTTTHRLTTRK